MKKLLAALLCCGMLLCAAACNPHHDKITRDLEAMDTYMTLEIYGTDSMAVTGIISNIEGVDQSLSVTNADGDNNELYLINQNGGGRMSETYLKLVRQALELCEETGGALDVTVLPVVEEWGFISKNYQIPSRERLSELLPLVDYRKVSVEGDRVQLEQKGMKLDFGAVAKGYAADLAMEILQSSGSECAILNLGGTVVAFGEKRGGKPWTVGVADPENSASYMGYLRCTDKIIATSGSYERCFTGGDGKTYSHIIDPKTGIPVDNEILSVTIISDSGLRSDGLSTALFVMGREKAEQFRREHPDFDYIILTKDKKAYVTPGAAESFTVAEGYDYEIVK